MSRIFLCYSNSQRELLPFLKEEDDYVYDVLASREKKGHFRLHRESYSTRETIAKNLILYRDEVILFHFSGHAGRNNIELADQTANGDGLAFLLGLCPRLKLIILNGCSTHEQVRQLASLPNRPIVIATNAVVGDRAAMEFSKTLYRELSQQFDTLASAFEIAISTSKLFQGNVSEVVRGSFIPSANRNLWGIFYANRLELEWKLPNRPHYRTSNFECNSYLIRALVPACASYNKKLQDEIERRGEGNLTLSFKRGEIIKSFPDPISDQLRKLLVPSVESTYQFYDKLGKDRLHQLYITFQTAMEFLAFIMLSQFWDEYRNKPNLNIDDRILLLLKGVFFKESTTTKSSVLLDIIQSIIELLRSNNLETFVFDSVQGRSDFLIGEKTSEICQYFDAQSIGIIDRLDEKDIADNCITSEEYLTYFLDRMAFLCGYSVISVLDIEVMKFKHSIKPTYAHDLVELRQSLGGESISSGEHDEPMDASSVIMTNRSERNSKYLNLSPFVIDQNAFENGFNKPRLRFFSFYIKERDQYFFKHVYKPADNNLEVSDEPSLKLIKDQFDAFSEMIFQRKLNEVE